MKNPKPTTIALLLAGSIAFLAGIGSLVLGLKVLNALVLYVALFVLSYFIIYNFMQVFIYRKIKLIYKSIHNLKLGKDSAYGEHLSDDPVNEVEKEVTDWAKSKRREIDELKRMEQFRKDSFVGTGPEVATRIRDLATEVGVQEMAVVTWTHDEDVRRESYTQLAKAFGLKG